MALALCLCVAFFCAALIALLHLFLEFKREEREHVEVMALGHLYAEEIAKIEELKSKVDRLAIKVGLR